MIVHIPSMYNTKNMLTVFIPVHYIESRSAHETSAFNPLAAAFRGEREWHFPLCGNTCSRSPGVTGYSVASLARQFFLGNGVASVV